MTNDPATDDSNDAGGDGGARAIRKWFYSPAAGWWLWGASIAALVILVAWIAWDPKFQYAVLAQKGQLHSLTQADAPVTLTNRVPVRTGLLWLLTGVGVATVLGILVSLFIGATAHRSLRSWFALTVLVAAWLTVCVGWPEIAWQGRRLGLWWRLDQFEAVAASLREHWPESDGEQAQLGSFMAYPKENPQMLMLLKPATGTTFAAVERADDGALRFELRGLEPGLWLEWQSADSAPHDFTGGLDTEYRMQRSSPLGKGWYLVRYR